MTKHRTITSFVAVALLAVAATTVTLRPSKHHASAPPGFISVSELASDVNKLATDDYDDLSLVYSAKRN